MAASLTSVATLIIFGERFLEGAWTYLVMLPLLYLMFTYFRRRLGAPTPLEERLGLLQSQRKYLSVVETEYPTEGHHRIDNVMVTLDGSSFAEQALPAADTLCRTAGPMLGIGKIPVGIITALSGGPFFIVLLRRRAGESQL